MSKSQIKSKQRVVDHGEVFTNSRDVKAMCDLVKQETDRVDSRFLEPACGEGAFLTEILQRKLVVVAKKYGKSPCDYERYAVLAVMNIYGVDIMEDNVVACQKKLFEIWDKEYTSQMRSQAKESCREVVKFILQKNILCGDALTLKMSDGRPIIFSEWSLVIGDMVKRRDYALSELLAGHDAQMNIFQIDWDYDEEIQAFIPKPIQEYPLTNYMRLTQYE